MIAFVALWLLSFLMLPVFADMRQSKSTLVLPYAIGTGLIVLGIVGCVVIGVPEIRGWNFVIIALGCIVSIFVFSNGAIVKTIRREIRLEFRALAYNGIYVPRGYRCDGYVNSSKLFEMLLLAYFSSTFIIALLTGVINGDAQIYNVSRVYSWLLSDTMFLETHSNGYHAYMSIGHDLLYVLDSSIGSTYGLGLVCWSESLALFLLVVSVACDGSRPFIGKQISPGVWAALLYMSVPLFYFQSSSVKNDLAVTLFGALFCVCVYRVYIERRLMNKKSQAEMMVLAITYGLASYNVKSYGILAVIAVLVTVVALAFLKAETRVESMVIRDDLDYDVKPLVIKSSIVLGQIVLMLLFSVHIQRYWGVEKASIVSNYTTGLIRGGVVDMQVLTNPLRIIYEMVLQLPLPIRVENLPGMQFLGSHGGTYEYAFGGYFGEDIAWCGFGFLVVAIYGILRYINSIKQKRISQSEFLVYSSCFYMVAICLSILWQPWYSRFLGFFYIGIIAIAAQGMAATSSLSGKSLYSWIILGGYGTLMAAVKGLAIAAHLQFIDSDRYVMKSHGQDVEEIRSTIKNSLSSKANENNLDVCIDGGPTLYILKELYAKVREYDIKEVGFPSREECEKVGKNHEAVSEGFSNVSFIQREIGTSRERSH